MSRDPSFIKHRHIGFQQPHPDPKQAESAADLLGDVEGVLEVRLLDANHLSVRYDIRVLRLEELELALKELGFHLDNSLFCKLRRALYHYTEETLRANLGLLVDTCDDECARRIFARYYQSRQHGCRDDRPRHWRRYL